MCVRTMPFEFTTAKAGWLITPNFLQTSPVSAIFTKLRPHSTTLFLESSGLSILAATPTTFTELFASTTVGASLRQVSQFGAQNQKSMF